MVRSKFAFILLMIMYSLVGCNSGNADSPVAGISGVTLPNDRGVRVSGGTSDNTSLVGPTCKSNDPDHFCLALNYVTYKNSNGDAAVSQNEAIDNVQEINEIWNQCNIGFQIETYQAVSPSKYGLNYTPADENELTDIRQSFINDSALLVVTTGSWDRSGSLGYSAANAWTNMPGDDPYGVVLEKSVGTFSAIIAHELGHYLNLLHVGDDTDLMNPIIYGNSTTLTSDQCSDSRAAVSSYWQKMVRK